MTEEEQKKEDNKKKLLFALAILLGDMTEDEIKKSGTWDDLSEKVQKKAVIEYKKNEEILKPLEKADKLEQPSIQEAMKEVGSRNNFKYYRIANPMNGRTCEKCKKWVGKIVSDEDPLYPSTQDWMDSGALHPRCECSLHDVSDEEIIKSKADDYLERKDERLRQLRESSNSKPEERIVVLSGQLFEL